MNIIVVTLVLTITLAFAQDDPQDVRHDIGRTFFIPRYDMLDDLSGGSSILKSDLKGCIHEVSAPKTTERFLFYEDTTYFYNSLSEESTISGDLKSFYTMGATLTAVTGGLGTDTSDITGASLDIAAYSRKEYIDISCIYGGELVDTVKSQFERLPIEISDHSSANSWLEYDSFLRTVGSHVVSQAYYGSRINQYVFTKNTTSYKDKDFHIKACEQFEGPTEVGLLGIHSCQQFNRSDTQTITHMESNTKLVLRGGTDKTRAALSTVRTRELIEKFLTEANISTLPIRYTYIPIWTLLHSLYMHTPHMTRVIFLENYYKGYLNFGCPSMTINGLTVQKFELVEGSDVTRPDFRCAIIPTGCNSNDDCHFKLPYDCECRGDTCFRYRIETNSHTGDPRYVPYAFTESGWDREGCYVNKFKCYCDNKDAIWEMVWHTDEEISIVPTETTERAQPTARFRNEL